MIKMTSKNSGRYAVSMSGNRSSSPENIIWCESAVSYGSILAAVTSEGAPCAILLHPSDTKSENALLTDLKRRFSGIAINKEETTTSPAAKVMLTRLVDFVKSHNSVTDASQFEKEAKDLQNQSILFGTTFQHSVWKGMTQVPIGSVCTYSQLAQKAGQSSKATRAVAQACGANPLTFLFPCHRIVAQGGGLGGYHWGTTTKKAILEDERKITSEKSSIRPGKRMKLLHT
ncbi:methylated-DNA--cysteine S-met [Meira miltonrushii]|uniref:Methylated-DNA--protein-cysteine methyltransferase n=1 Tax=Meira miltonrushii TaxID=1280837 RepID=A0A316VAH7_9BASI|nr:methylated-DNA--cysteine S-met [Meira miltonrushii]PWN34629.1 methylated-DNA--cysteine S-met [Meira miltonrushii]